MSVENSFYSVVPVIAGSCDLQEHIPGLLALETLGRKFLDV